MNLEFYNPKGVVRKLSKPEYKFVKFIKECSKPITQKSILNYWTNHVRLWDQKEETKYCPDQKCYVGFNRDYTKKEMETLANMWFDRWAGKFYRLGMTEQIILNTIEQ